MLLQLQNASAWMSPFWTFRASRKVDTSLGKPSHTRPACAQHLLALFVSYLNQSGTWPLSLGETWPGRQTQYTPKAHREHSDHDTLLFPEKMWLVVAAGPYFRACALGIDVLWLSWLSLRNLEDYKIPVPHFVFPWGACLSCEEEGRRLEMGQSKTERTLQQPRGKGSYPHCPQCCWA